MGKELELELEPELELELELELEKNAGLSDSRKRLCNEKNEQFLICLLNWKFWNIEYRSWNIEY